MIKANAVYGSQNVFDGKVDALQYLFAIDAGM